MNININVLALLNVFNPAFGLVPFSSLSTAKIGWKKTSFCRKRTSSFLMSSKTTGHSSDIHWHDFDIHKEDYDDDTDPEMSKEWEIEGVDVDSLDHHVASEYILSESILDAIRHTGDRQLSPPHIIDPIGDKNPKDLTIDEALTGKGMHDYGYDPSSHTDREAEAEDLARENGYSE
eukprot:302250_1